MEQDNQIKLILEDLKVDPDKINEFLVEYRKVLNKDNLLKELDKEFQVWTLLNEEPNWKKRSMLAAKIISLKLE